jgi:GalNAc-alpha-(1->4)-GalNAc-alpha-(1->3)-diNAcBac-PP-undecaprenol alpha-1,4-N-acetyl-D-galactosaminyltransferase
MKRIVIITPSLKSGGLERVASLLANKGVRKFKIILLTLDNKQPFYNLNKEVELIQCPQKISKQNKGIRFITNAIWLRKTLRNLKPDVACSFGEKYNSFVLLSALGLGFPVFVANRASPLSSLKGFRGFVNPIAYLLADGVLLQTQKSKDLLETKYKFKNTTVIGNPVDLDYPKLPRKNIVLNVGSIGGQKNQDWLIRYFSSCVNQINDVWSLEFIGDGPNRQFCKKIANQIYLNKSNKIVFHGIKKNPKPYYAMTSVFAFTSTSEGFPNALGEAMAAGCACVAYDCVAGPSDMIDNGINGFLISIGDEKQYLKKLQLLMEDETTRIKFGKAAQEKMKQFEASTIADKFYNFITKGIENSN